MSLHLSPDRRRTGIRLGLGLGWRSSFGGVERDCEAGTAALAMPVGRGAPDLGRFVPAKLEWLIASRVAARGKPLMRPLPPAPDREALIATVRDRIGARWVGESIPFADARTRSNFPRAARTSRGGNRSGRPRPPFPAVLLLVLLLSPVFLFPAGFALGAWLFRGGLSGLRDAISVANTPTARVSSAAIGLVELEGLAKTAQSFAGGRNRATECLVGRRRGRLFRQSRERRLAPDGGAPRWDDRHG